MPAPVIVIGAGPAGLAVSACLKRRGLEAVLLERSGQVGTSWRNHYERLHLHTARAHSALPGLPFPAEYPVYPSRAQVVDYLDSYARTFELRPRFGVAVEAIAPSGTGWTVRWADGALDGPDVVVTTGLNAVPHAPQWPGREAFPGEVLHAADYRTGEAFAGKRVLVVGAGNSGGEIALDLVERGARVSLCVRGPFNVMPRDLFGVSAQAIGVHLSAGPVWLKDAMLRAISRVTFGDLTRFGLRPSPRGPATQIVVDGSIPLIDVGTIGAIKRGAITVVPGLERFTPTGVRCVDGREFALDAVVLATGYRTGLGPLFTETPEVLDDAGRPRALGAETTKPGLFFVGFRNPITGFLRGIGLDAEAVATAIAERRAGR